MSNRDRVRLVRESYRAYETADRERISRIEVCFGWDLE
jgi:hypothetical protein